jgi:hypothetical protein
MILKSKRVLTISITVVGLLLIFSAMNQQAAAQTWDVEYHGDVLPTADGWLLRGECDNVTSLSGGILQLDVQGCTDDHEYYIEWDPGDSFTCEIRVAETEAMYGTATCGAAVTFTVEHNVTDVTWATVEFHVDKVTMCLSGWSTCYIAHRPNYTLSTYRFCYDKPKFEVYRKIVDSPEEWEQLISKDLTIWFGTAPQYEEIGFGKCYNTNHPGGSQQWDYVKYNNEYNPPENFTYYGDEHRVPSLTTYGLMFLALTILAAGGWMILRRYRTATT